MAFDRKMYLSYCAQTVIRRDMEKEENRKTLQARKKVICDLVKDPIYVPMKEKELAALLQVAREDREELRTVLRELLDEGKLTLTAKGKYVKSSGRFLTGTFISNAKGFGFVRLDGTDQGDSIGREIGRAHV